MGSEKLITITTRLPRDVRDWLAAQAERNATSINSEIIRAVRDAMDRQARDARQVPDAQEALHA
jgi:hypothetical protein